MTHITGAFSRVRRLKSSMTEYKGSQAEGLLFGPSEICSLERYL